MRQTLAEEYSRAATKHAAFAHALTNLADALHTTEVLDTVRLQAEQAQANLLAAKYALEDHLRTHQCAGRP